MKYLKIHLIWLRSKHCHLSFTSLFIWKEVQRRFPPLCWLPKKTTVAFDWTISERTSTVKNYCEDLGNPFLCLHMLCYQLFNKVTLFDALIICLCRGFYGNSPGDSTRNTSGNSKIIFFSFSDMSLPPVFIQPVSGSPLSHTGIKFKFEVPPQTADVFPQKSFEETQHVATSNTCSRHGKFQVLLANISPRLAPGAMTW